MQSDEWAILLVGGVDQLLTARSGQLVCAMVIDNLGY